MRLFLGLDCGGTQTRAFVTDPKGAAGGWGHSGQTNPHHSSSEEIRAHLREAIAASLAAVGGEPGDCLALFAGVAGVTDGKTRETMVRHLVECGFGQARIEVDHDIRIALAGGLAGAPGIALIVGTGSSCYGRAADGRTRQTGGWGALISNEGSGYFIGREAICSAARMADGREPETHLRQVVFSAIGLRDFSELLPRLHEPGLSLAEIAALAPAVIEQAGMGDPAARSILERGAAGLAEMVDANHRQLPATPHPLVVITGGLGAADTPYRGMIEEAIRSRLPSAKICRPRLPPAIGASMLALEHAGCPMTPAHVEQLARFA